MDPLITGCVLHNTCPAQLIGHFLRPLTVFHDLQLSAMSSSCLSAFISQLLLFLRPSSCSPQTVRIDLLSYLFKSVLASSQVSITQSLGSPFSNVSFGNHPRKFLSCLHMRLSHPPIEMSRTLFLSILLQLHQLI